MLTSERRPRVLLADDYPDMIRAIRHLLEPDCVIVGSVNDGAQLVEATTRLQPDVVILDLRMPTINGLVACRDIRAAAPNTKVIIFTAAREASIRGQAIEAGAADVVLKSRAVQDLLPAIRTVLAEDS